MHNYDLGDAEHFVKVLDLEVHWAHSYADMQPGKTDRERRENYRRAATGMLAPIPDNPRWWAFRIGVQKSGRALDVDNVAKTIIDAFCTLQILKDQSPCTELGLFHDDTFDHVRVLQVVGERGAADKTRIEIFASITPALTATQGNAPTLGEEAACVVQNLHNHPTDSITVGAVARRKTPSAAYTSNATRMRPCDLGHPSTSAARASKRLRSTASRSGRIRNSQRHPRPTRQTQNCTTNRAHRQPLTTGNNVRTTPNLSTKSTQPTRHLHPKLLVGGHLDGTEKRNRETQASRRDPSAPARPQRLRWQ